MNKRRVVDNALNEMLGANSLQVEIPVEFSYRGSRKKGVLKRFWRLSDNINGQTCTHI
jgi:hypothetical protein